jgi:hypothetical protein
MKQIFAILLSVMMALPAMATDRGVKVADVVRISQELQSLYDTLEKDKSDRNTAIRNAIISAVLATFLIKSGVKRINNPTGGDIASGMDMGLGIASVGAGASIGAYGAGQGYRIYYNVRDISRIQKDIQAKQEELEIAKKVLETIE